MFGDFQTDDVHQVGDFLGRVHDRPIRARAVRSGQIDPTEGCDNLGHATGI